MKNDAKFCKSSLCHALFSLEEKKFAFSLIELMVSLIVISLVAVSFSPVITKKLKNKEINTSLASKDSLPVGTIVAYLGQSAPEGWLLCDGKTFSETKYPKLKLFLGKNKTPDLRGYIPKGATEEENK